MKTRKQEHRKSISILSLWSAAAWSICLFSTKGKGGSCICTAFKAFENDKNQEGMLRKEHWKGNSNHAPPGEPLCQVLLPSFLVGRTYLEHVCKPSLYILIIATLPPLSCPVAEVLCCAQDSELSTKMTSSFFTSYFQYYVFPIEEDILVKINNSL